MESSKLEVMGRQDLLMETVQCSSLTSSAEIPTVKSLNFRYFRKASSLSSQDSGKHTQLNQEPLLYPQYSCCCYQYPSPLLVEGSPGAHHCQTQHQSSGALLPVLHIQPSLFSHLSPCFAGYLSIVEARDTHVNSKKVSSLFLPLTCPHRPLFICEETEAMATCFSVEDFVIVLPGRGQFQNFWGSLTPPLLLFLAPVSPLQKRQLCPAL